MQTSGTTAYSKGDVVLVRFPFTNQTSGKPRPAIVLSTRHYNDTCPDVVIASVTSNLNPLPHVGDYRIVDWKEAGLLYPSIAQTKITTIEATIIIRKLGELHQSDMAQFEAGLRAALGL